MRSPSQALPQSHAISLTPSSALFFTVHLVCIGAFFVHFSWWMVLVLALSYAIRMFAVTAGYHRYFSHRSYKLGRVPQFLMAFLAQTSAQKGVLWWASHHRDHHKFSDSEQDIHSPKQQGFWHSHVGWILSAVHDDYDKDNIKDFEKFPELRFISRHHWICPWALGIFSFKLGQWMGVGGLSGLMWAFLLPTVLLWHGTFTINSLCHVWGSRRFETSDTSRNNLFLALLTLGEGWHNNHHHYQNACRQGIRWWEVDITWYTLKILSWMRVVRDMKPFPRHWMAAPGLQPES